MRALLEELKAAVSGLARVPTFTALAVGVLGLGLGAVIFMYGVADAVMLKPAPYPNAERLYTIVTIDGHTPGAYDVSMQPMDYERFRESQTQFEAIGSIYDGTAYLTGDGQAERYDGAFADGYVFDVTGVAPELGRTIEPRDTLEGAAPVVVLSHALWHERFGADPNVIGRIMRVNGRSSEVIGVMPEGYSFPARSAFWVANQKDPTRTERATVLDVQVYGRLRADGSADLVQQELEPLAAQVRQEAGADVFNGRFEVVPFHRSFMGDDQKLIWTLLAAVGFVLLIACANVSNLLLARSAYRVRETTVRSALGASRGRLVVHMLAEGLLISILATLLGLLLASIALDGFQLAMERMSQGFPAWWTFEIDSRVVAVAVLAALLSTLAAGLPAAWRASRPALDTLLRDGGRMGTGLAIGRIAWGLVVFEVALACLLLGVSALMTKGVLTATRSDIGVDASDIMTARVGVTANIYPEEKERIRFWETLVQRIEAQPGVESASVTNALPGHDTFDGKVTVEGRDYGGEATKPTVTGTSVSPSFFKTFRIAPTQGRLFDSRDSEGTPQVIVINEHMARTLFPGESPLGKRIRFELSVDRGWDTIVGVVPDIVMNQEGRVESHAFVSVLQRGPSFMSIAMRGQGDPRSLAAAARTALAETNPDLALYWVRTFEESRVIATAGFRIIGTIFVVFAGVAVALAAAGLFGVLAFHVGQRTREIGVRRALGADSRRILSLVMRASGLQIGLGILIGMLLLPFMARGLGDILQDQSPFDPVIYGSVLGLMLAVAIAATLAPTRRALNVDPASALRQD